MLRLGWFSTGRDEAARQLLQVVYKGIDSGDIDARIAFVFGSRSPGETPQSDLFLQLVKNYGIPCVHLSFKDVVGSAPVDYRDTPRRAAYDRQVIELLKGFKVDLCIMAGYMLIISPELCHHYDFINLHPAMPNGPKGTWQEVIWQLIEQRALSSGVMMHLVTPELDRGPAVAYCTYSLRTPSLNPLWTRIQNQQIEETNALFRLIRQEGLKREFPLILATIKAFSRGQVRVENGIILNKEGKPIPGYDLTPEIESSIENDLALAKENDSLLIPVPKV